jgi:putative endonuclease
MASRTHVFYVGVTNDIVRRVREHKQGTFEGFTSRYHIDRLVWYEVWPHILTAIAREKQIKPWRREKKIRLIESLNPTWQDLAEDWGRPIQPLRRTADPSARAEAVGRDDKVGKGRCVRDDKMMTGTHR